LTSRPRNPYPTVDIIIEIAGGIVLVERRNPPYGWALPGGFVEYGETAERAAIREAREETGLEVRLVRILGVYSSPDRDPRFHTLSTVYIAQASGQPRGGDDAARAEVFPLEALPEIIAFDHRRIIEDYKRFDADGTVPLPGL
jgi:ADP-ribose pyrophosphatase YjhB (NUDIX family)